MQYVEHSVVALIAGLLLLNAFSGATLIKEVKRLNQRNAVIWEQVMQDQALFVGELQKPSIPMTKQPCHKKAKTVAMKKPALDCQRGSRFVDVRETLQQP